MPYGIASPNGLIKCSFSRVTMIKFTYVVFSKKEENFRTANALKNKWLGLFYFIGEINYGQNQNKKKKPMLSGNTFVHLNHSLTKIKRVLDAIITILFRNSAHVFFFFGAIQFMQYCRSYWILDSEI